MLPFASRFEFHRLTPEDAISMHGLEKKCFSLPWNLEQCRRALAQPAFAAFGLWQRDCLACYLSFYHAAGEIEILNLAVLPELRRRGLASRALSMLLQVARKMGMQKAALEVRESNHAAIGLYELFGFVRAGVRKRYYPDTGEDALIMIREIGCSAQARYDSPESV